MSEWKDISTAPKDGTNIDVWCKEEGRITNAYWRNDRWTHWSMNGFEMMDHVKLDYAPSHWMHIPDDPPCS